MGDLDDPVLEPVPIDARVRAVLALAGDPKHAGSVHSLYVITTKLPIARVGDKVVGLFLGIRPSALLDSAGRYWQEEEFRSLVDDPKRTASAKWFRFLHPLAIGSGEPSYATLKAALADDAQVKQFRDLGLALGGAGQLGPDLQFSAIDAHFRPAEVPRPGGGSWTGAGVLVGIVDAGCDVAHKNLRTADAGGSRVELLVDQNKGVAPNFQEWAAAQIDVWLPNGNPSYATYDPHDNGFGDGARPDYAAHGTHVADIAAGNGRAQHTAPGVAPGAAVAFVHVKVDPATWKADFGLVAAAVRRIFRKAGTRPCVVNISLSDNAGPHIAAWREAQDLDLAISEANPNPGTDPCRAVVVSAGNNHGMGLHVRRRLTNADNRVNWRWNVDAADLTDNVMQIWTDARLLGGLVALRLTAENGVASDLPVNRPAAYIRVGGTIVGLMQRLTAPDVPAGFDAIEVTIYAPQPAGGPALPQAAGKWTVRVEDPQSQPRLVDAWLLRDQKPAAAQSRFLTDRPLDDECTIGQLACAANVIAVGAHVGCVPPPKFLFPWTSAGPTREDRERPDITAPGYLVHAAWSKHGDTTTPTVSMSGTSMAAPHVTGAIALLLEKNANLTIGELRTLLRDNAAKTDPPLVGWDARRGSGRLDVGAALADALALAPVAAAGAPQDQPA